MREIHAAVEVLEQAARKHDVEVDRVGVVHGKPRTGRVLDQRPAHRAGRNHQVEEVGHDPDLAGYEVVMRETTAADWTSAIRVGNVTAITLDISKDNVQFGVRAVDTAGHRSPVAFPQVAA